MEALTRLGGVAAARALLETTSRRALRRALAAGLVHRAGRDRYVLPAPDQARRAATMVNGVLILLSAALHHGWEVRLPPVRPQIGVPRGRTIVELRSAEVRRVDTAHDGWATTPLATVLMCADQLPWADALAVADSALRHGTVSREELLVHARGSRQRRVAEHADGRAANPFESALRAILIEEGWSVVPQYEVGRAAWFSTPTWSTPSADSPSRPSRGSGTARTGRRSSATVSATPRSPSRAGGC